MDDERLEQRLRRVRLSVPRVTLEEIEARTQRRPGSRPLLRLALATAAVWLAAWAAQAAVEHGLQGPPVAAHAAVAAEHHPHGTAPGLLVRRQLMDELAPDTRDALGPVRTPPAEGDTPKGDSAALRRRSSYV